MAMLRVKVQDIGPENILLPPAGPGRLANALKVTILQRLWDQRHNVDSGSIAQFETYFRVFWEECRSAGKTLPIKTFGHLLSLVQYLKLHRSRPRKDLLDFFGSDPAFSHLCEDEQKYNAIDLAVRFLLMIRVTGLHDRGIIGLHTSILWREEWSLEEMIAAHFSFHPPNPLEKPRWPYMLNARILERIGNFKIVWTDDLQDHLLLDEDDKSIRVYHHATVLTALSSSSIEGCFPEGFLIETLQTLALLLPSRVNRDCRKWFETQLQEAVKQRGLVDPQAGNQILNLEGRLPRTYKYWGERLSIIKNALDDAEPTTLYQWWTDRRKGVQRWTFWLAATALLLTLLFGFAQTLLVAWQVYLLYHPPRF